MEFTLGKKMKLSAMLMLLLLCVGWAQPFLPHSCWQHGHCAIPQSCCTPENGVAASVRHHGEAAEFPNCHDSGPALAKQVAVHAQDNGHSIPDRDCSPALCHEWQHQITVAPFGVPQPAIYNSSVSPLGGERFSSLPSSGLFRPPRLVFTL